MAGLVGGFLGLAVIYVFLADAFETILLPRRVSRNLRFTRLFYHTIWPAWRWMVARFRLPKRRSFLLSVFAPLSLLLLFATWVVGLVLGFALLHMSLGTDLTGFSEATGLFDYCYFSGVTFLTLGYGDLAPKEPLGRFLAVAEAAVGFGFLAIVNGYLPVMYQGFSRREIQISLLDARAGSPPTAVEFLIRLSPGCREAAFNEQLKAWEIWASELLESHVSFPVLALFRSQHDNQSWLATLTLILDTTSMILAGRPGASRHQARLTYAMARHAAVDLAQAFLREPVREDRPRLDEEGLHRLVDTLVAAEYTFENRAHFGEKFLELREAYEPFINTLADYCLFAVPPIMSDQPVVDNWQTSSWMRRTQGLGKLAESTPDDHDD